MFPFRYFLDSQKSFYNIDHSLEGLFLSFGSWLGGQIWRNFLMIHQVFDIILNLKVFWHMFLLL